MLPRCMFGDLYTDCYATTVTVLSFLLYCLIHYTEQHSIFDVNVMDFDILKLLRLFFLRVYSGIALNAVCEGCK